MKFFVPSIVEIDSFLHFHCSDDKIDCKQDEEIPIEILGLVIDCYLVIEQFSLLEALATVMSEIKFYFLRINNNM